MVTGCVGDLYAVAAQDWQRRSEVDPIQTRKPRAKRSWSVTGESWLPSNSWLHLDPSYIINTHTCINPHIYIYICMYTVSKQLDISFPEWSISEFGHCMWTYVTSVVPFEILSCVLLCCIKNIIRVVFLEEIQSHQCILHIYTWDGRWPHGRKISLFHKRKVHID